MEQLCAIDAHLKGNCASALGNCSSLSKRQGPCFIGWTCALLRETKNTTTTITSFCPARGASTCQHLPLALLAYAQMCWKRLCDRARGTAWQHISWEWETGI
eukprot:1136489-Pelagomonas_calceolata.AAC.4